ncbi:MAG: hypothetical protein LJE65_04345 [Desulfobacteraceae bacterium]|jgi:hypothetical protein|nr:hypothetical protein [Desulfobacteraceae bacterium]
MILPFHRLPIPVLAGMAWLAATAAAGTAQQGPSLPPEMAAYYRDTNFVAAFSTVEERQRLSAGQESPETALPRDGRLADVRNAMERLKDRTWQPFSEQETLPEDVLVRSDWMRVIQVFVDRETAMVRVRVVPVPQRLQEKWIAGYEPERATSPSDGDHRRSQDVGTADSRVEMHFWFTIDGRWMRKEGGIAQSR